jgi:hypothetical protein
VIVLVLVGMCIGVNPLAVVVDNQLLVAGDTNNSCLKQKKGKAIKLSPFSVGYLFILC